MSFAYRTSEKPDDLTVLEFAYEVLYGLIGFAFILSLGIAFLYLTDWISFKLSDTKKDD